jgi:ABC-type anion transport system duplicated permease subunit
MEARLERLESRVDSVEKSIFDLHSKSMQFVNDKFNEMERRLLDKIDLIAIPRSEHQSLMSRLDELYRRDLAGRSEWDVMVPQVKTLWEERATRVGNDRGRIWTGRLILGALAVVVSVAEIIHTAHDIGVHP